MAKKKKPRKSAFVPRMLVPVAAAVSVVPAVAVVSSVVSSCGSETQNTTYYGVAAVAYPAYEAGPEDASDDASDAAPDAASDAALEAGQG